MITHVTEHGQKWSMPFHIPVAAAEWFEGNGFKEPTTKEFITYLVAAKNRKPDELMFEDMHYYWRNIKLLSHE